MSRQLKRLLMAARLDAARPLRGLRRQILEALLLRAPEKGIDYNPYDVARRQQIAEELFNEHERRQPIGSVGRSRLILRAIEQGFPTPRLEAEYFRNLEMLLADRRKRNRRGIIVLGLGTGRSGSTTLAALLSTIVDSCCTHENPPLIFWTPHPAQVRFHLRRLEYLADFFALVADVSHWWLNALDEEIFRRFPECRVVGTIRDVESCTRSFMRIKGYGRRTWNHWAPYGNNEWISHSWDPTYPTYPLTRLSRYPDRAKAELITRYVREYSTQLLALGERRPEQTMIVRTDDLNDMMTQRRLFAFIGLAGQPSEIRLNHASVKDSVSEDMWF